jgi:hypothetical protein
MLIENLYGFFTGSGDKEMTAFLPEGLDQFVSDC